jgi:hypothetical protein
MYEGQARFTSCQFMFTVRAELNNGNAIPSQTIYPVFEQMIANGNQTITGCQTATEGANQATTNVNNAIDALNIKKSEYESNENTRIAAERIREENEITRKEFYAQSQSNEQVRLDNEYVIEVNESLRQATMANMIQLRNNNGVLEWLNGDTWQSV